MYSKLLAGLTFGMMAVAFSTGPAARVQTPQTAATAPQASAAPTAEADDPIRTLVGRLDLEKYKATIKGLTQFGDRRQGTDRNRAAIDWIEAQLKSYGCTNTERIKYRLPAPRAAAAARAGARVRARGRGWRTTRRAGAARTGQGGSTIFGNRGRTGVNNDPNAQTGRQAARAQRTAEHTGTARTGVLHQGRHDPSRRDVYRRRPHGRHRLRAKPPTTTAREPPW